MDHAPSGTLSGDERWGHGADLSKVPEERRCIGINLDGSRCRKWANEGMPWCWRHLRIERARNLAAQGIGDEADGSSIRGRRFDLVEPSEERDRSQTPSIPPVAADGEVWSAQRVPGYRLQLDGSLLTHGAFARAVGSGEIPWPPPLRRPFVPRDLLGDPRTANPYDD